jgi:hypothetical protein
MKILPIVNTPVFTKKYFTYFNKYLLPIGTPSLMSGRIDMTIKIEIYIWKIYPAHPHTSTKMLNVVLLTPVSDPLFQE